MHLPSPALFSTSPAASTETLLSIQLVLAIITQLPLLLSSFMPLSLVANVL